MISDRSRLFLVALLAAAVFACAPEPSGKGREENAVEKVESQPGPKEGRALATFGGGCFWCVEAVFLRVDGVISVRSGFAGGKTDDPTYDAVTSGATGHAEAVQIEYDTSKVGYASLLEVFFATHDPTTLNRQGADVGAQYRSIVLWHDADQKARAEKAKKELDAAGIFDDPIVTEIAPYAMFWPAAAYHQDYYSRNASQPYCQFVIRPKLEKLKKLFRDRLK